MKPCRHHLARRLRDLKGRVRFECIACLKLFVMS